jgi:hypothetical protein
MEREREQYRSPGERDVTRPQAGAEQQSARDLASTIGNRAFTTGVAARQIARKPDDERLTRDKDAAKEMLVELRDSTADFARAERRWLSANWVKFFGLTSSNPSLGLGQDVMQGLVSNTLGNAVAEGAAWIFGKLAARGAGVAAGTAAGGMIAGPPGAVIGFVVGVLIETAVGLIYDAIRPSSEERAAADASKRTAALIENSEQALQAHETAAIEKGREKVGELGEKLAELDDSQEVVEFHREVRSEKAKIALNKPNPSEKSLAQSLIQEWAMEHAGDENDPNSDTSEAQWEDAVAAGFGGADELEGRLETFAYQTRGHFASVGLDTKGAQWVIDDIDPNVPYDRPRAPGSSEEPEFTPLGGDAVTGVRSRYNRQRFYFDKAVNPEALIGFLGRGYAEPSEEGKQAIREGRFKLECVVNLEDDERTVYVDEWEYKLTFPGEGRWWDRTSPPHARRNPLEFSHSPD